MMNSDAKMLRQDVKSAKLKYEAAKARLAAAEQACSHDWTEPEYDPIRYKGYHSLGDPPGTMGVDRRLPLDVPSRTEDRWRRECRKCGKVQVTTFVNTETVENKTPRFPS